jgi:hypothetical protein
MIAAWWMRYRGILTAIPWMAIGGALTVLVGRIFLIDEIRGQDMRHSARIDTVAVRVASIDSTFSGRLRNIEAGLSILVKGECMRRTRFEQQRDELGCPEHLYRGAPQ